jgi:GT2 family glycosyltransferase
VHCLAGRTITPRRRGARRRRGDRAVARPDAPPTAEAPRRTRVRFLATPPGLPRQRNIGATLAGGSVIVFLDDDVVLEPGYLAAIAAVYEDDSARAIGGVGGAQVPDPTPAESRLRRAVCRLFLLDSYGEGRLKRSGRPSYLLSPREQCTVEFLSGCNMSYRRDVLSELDFDERLCGYALGEDLDFSYRASRRWTLVVTPAARCDHRHAAGGRPETDDFRAMSAFNKYLFFREHVARGPLDWLPFVWSTIGRVLLRLRNPGRRGLRGMVRGHWLVLRHLATGRGAVRPVCRATAAGTHGQAVRVRRRAGARRGTHARRVPGLDPCASADRRRIRGDRRRERLARRDARRRRVGRRRGSSHPRRRLERAQSLPKR